MGRPNDREWLGERVLRKSRTADLRARMADFADEHGDRELKTLRDRGSSGTSLAELVNEGRDERV